MTQDRIDAWRKLQQDIEHCKECLTKWSKDITHPLRVGEIPDPPRDIKLLFVGVAPTAAKGRNRGNHFYSSQTDGLRLGLFGVLDGLLKTRLLEENANSLSESNKSFHNADLFFVHATKVRPIQDDAPPADAIAFCAEQHLRFEIPLLQPKGVCFVGKNNTKAAASRLFGQEIGETPTIAMLGAWRGLVAIAHQPRRGWEEKTHAVISKFRQALNLGPTR